MTLRTRLALLFAVMTLAVGGVLVTINYVITARSLEVPERLCVADGLEQRCVLPPDFRGALPAPAPAAVPGAFGSAIVINGRTPEEFLADQRARRLDRLRNQSLVAVGSFAALAAALGWWLAGRVLRPVHDITSTARRLSIDSLDSRIALTGPDDELKELADTFDAMLDRLEQAVALQKRFVADASHELRTPLAVLRTEVEVALADPDAEAEDLRAMAERARDAIARSERLVDSLLVLARSSEGALERDQNVDLGEIAAAVLGDLSGEAAAAHLEVTTSLQPAVVAGDPALVERLVANLVSNAVRHNVDRGTVSVRTAGRSLTVSNSGPVVVASEVAGLFEPFRRGGDARTGDRGVGVGLGLAIVRSVAGAHGASVDARPREGGGLDVVATFAS